VTQAPALAAILATREPQRLYSGLSVIVSTAAEGQRCLALATFGALELVLERDFGDGERFTRSLGELLDTALELDEVEMYACAASVDSLGLGAEAIERQLRGVLSTPRFLREAAGAPLIFV
jgi:peroxiredoxin family protein